jgi:putative transposase
MRTDEEVEVHRRANRLRAAPGRERHPAGGLGVSELRKLRSLEDENGRLKRLVADLTLDKHMLTEALRKKV